MRGLLLAFAEGFWHSLVQFVQAGARGGFERVQALARKFPFSISLDATEAMKGIELAKEGITAANNWYYDRMPSGLYVPKVQLPDVTNINGGPPGKYQFGVIVRGDELGVKNTNLIASSDELPSVDSVLERIGDYMRENVGLSGNLDKFLMEITENYQIGRRDIVIPNWLVERIYGE